jgi:hypothetical protein
MPQSISVPPWRNHNLSSHRLYILHPVIPSLFLRCSSMLQPKITKHPWAVLELFPRIKTNQLTNQQISSKVPRATSNPSTWTARAAVPVACAACGARRLVWKVRRSSAEKVHLTNLRRGSSWMILQKKLETAIYDDLWISERFDTKSFRIEPVGPIWVFDQQKLGRRQLSIVNREHWFVQPKKNIEEHRRFLMSTESTVDDFWINCCSLCRVPPPSLRCEFIAPLFYRRATACRRGSNLSCLKVVIPTLDGSKWFKPNPAVPSSGSKERNYHLVMTHNCSSPWKITIL